VKTFTLLLIIVPALEIALLMLSGDIIGIWPTAFLIVVTGVLGAFLAKRQGIEMIRKAQQQLMYGSIPSGAVLDGICILVGGALLLAPGFITDLIGLSLLIPFTRAAIKPLLGCWLKSVFEERMFFYTKR